MANPCLVNTKKQSLAHCAKALFFLSRGFCSPLAGAFYESVRAILARSVLMFTPYFTERAAGGNRVQIESADILLLLARDVRYTNNMESLLMPTLLAAVFAALATPAVIVAAKRLGVVDHPGGRRIHRRITPRLGGLAVVAGFFLALWAVLPAIAPNFRPGQLAAFALAALFLLVVGIIDDARGVPPVLQLASHVLVALVLVAVGMGIEEVSSPFGGGKIDLNVWQIAVPGFEEGRYLQLPADLLTVIWVVLVINAINWLDGLDGLASGVGLISAVTLALLSLSAAVGQPHVAILAMLLAGSLAGFLPYNFNPARIFLGTVGSTFVGFTLATLAIISGGKVATALLVLGFPIIDALTLIARRVAVGAPPWRADTRHLHHLLLARGLSVRRTVLALYGVTAAFGAIALLGGTTGNKLLALGLLVLLVGGILGWLVVRPVQATSSK